MINSKLLIVTWLLSLALIVISAYMHLTNVGMGRFGSSDQYAVIADAGMPKAGKLRTAVTAMTPSTFTDRLHRGVANLLELFIVAIVVVAWMKRRNRQSGTALTLPILGLLISLVLAFLGAWYGSPLRYPWIMILNLVGGYALLAIYWWLTMCLYPLQSSRRDVSPGLLFWLKVGLVLVVLQILLGAWTDAYYAAFADSSILGMTPGWSLGSLLQGLGKLGMLQVDDLGQVMIDANVAFSIRSTHLAVAALVFVVALLLAWKSVRAGGSLSLPGIFLCVTLLLQMMVGLVMVLLGISLQLVVAHTVLAALILLGVLTLLYRLRR